MSATRVWRLEVPRETPSGNITKREHWSTGHARALLWHTELMVAMSADKGIRDEGPYGRVHIISYRRRKLDKFDNLPFGMKEIIPDNLIKLGLIVDDSDDYCDITCEQVVISNDEKPRTVIEFIQHVPKETGRWKKFAFKS